MFIPLPGISPVAYAEYEVLLNREKKGKRHFVFNEDKSNEKSFEISLLLAGIATPEEVIKTEIMNQRLEKIELGVGIIIGKLNEHHQYLIEKLRNNQISYEIAEAIEELNAQQTTKVTKEIMRQISTAFELFSGDMDVKLKDIYTDLKKTNDLEKKLKLSVPLINLLGIELGVDWDVKSWAIKMHEKYQLKIFQLMV